MGQSKRHVTLKILNMPRPKKTQAEDTEKVEDVDSCDQYFEPTED